MSQFSPDLDPNIMALDIGLMEKMVLTYAHLKPSELAEFLKVSKASIYNAMRSIKANPKLVQILESRIQNLESRIDKEEKKGCPLVSSPTPLSLNPLTPKKEESLSSAKAEAQKLEKAREAELWSWFLRTWEIHPRPVSQKMAWKAYQKLFGKKLDRSVAYLIHLSIQKLAPEWEALKSEGKAGSIPHFSTYLNQERHLDNAKEFSAKLRARRSAWETQDAAGLAPYILPLEPANVIAIQEAAQ